MSILYKKPIKAQNNVLTTNPTATGNRAITITDKRGDEFSENRINSLNTSSLNAAADGRDFLNASESLESNLGFRPKAKMSWDGRGSYYDHQGTGGTWENFPESGVVGSIYRNGEDQRYTPRGERQRYPVTKAQLTSNPSAYRDVVGGGEEGFNNLFKNYLK